MSQQIVLTKSSLTAIKFGFEIFSGQFGIIMMKCEDEMLTLVQNYIFCGHSVVDNSM